MFIKIEYIKRSTEMFSSKADIWDKKTDKNIIKMQ